MERLGCLKSGGVITFGFYVFGLGFSRESSTFPSSLFYGGLKLKLVFKISDSSTFIAVDWEVSNFGRGIFTSIGFVRTGCILNIDVPKLGSISTGFISPASFFIYLTI